jgi:uncharacterized protein YgbK (DUF1537 family)
MKPHIVVNGQVVELTDEQIAEMSAQQDAEKAQYEVERKAKAWETLRKERNSYLSACDWTQVLDAPVDQSIWATYRKALRDLPENTTDPFNPVWPVAPT